MVVPNERKESVQMCPVTECRVCWDYQKFNSWNKKNRFPMPFLIKLLDILSGKRWYFFLHGYSGYNQISIAPEDQKDHFRLPLWDIYLQKDVVCVVYCIGHLQKCYGVDILWHGGGHYSGVHGWLSLVGDSFDRCLNTLAEVLRRCEGCNLVVNWKKCHFMVKDGIVLGHYISEKG